MSIHYKVVKQTFGFDKTGTEKYVIKTVTQEMLTFDKVCNQVSQICGAHRGTVTQVISGLLDVLVNNLDMGHSVQLGEFGTLRPGLRTRAQDNEEDANASAVYRKKVNFMAGKMLKNFMNDVAITRATPVAGDSADGGSGGSGSGGSGDPNA